MRFNVLIADNNIADFKDFNKYVKSKIKDVIINFSSNSDAILINIENSDLVILSENIENHLEIINKCKELNLYVVLLANEDTIDNNSNYDLKNLDTLYLPIDNDKLLYKIEHYIGVLNKDILLQKEQELSNSIINNITNPIFSTDGNHVIFANDFFYKLTGCENLIEINEKYENKIGSIFIDELDCIHDQNGDWLNKCENDDTKICILDPEGEKRFFSLQKIYLTHNDTNIIMLTDISYEIRHKNELFNLLYTDNLTKLPNRAKLIEQLQNNRSLVIGAIAIIDINSFKEVNDFFGHRIGDSILVEVGNIITEMINYDSSLKLFKFPADTYCITNSKENEEEFTDLIKKIIDIVYKKVFVFDQYEIDIRVSAGLSFSSKNNKLITADIALQSAKKDHKDFLIFYDELDKFQEYENNMLWTKKLKAAFSNDNIEVFYQPLINNNTLKVDKYECLVRLIDEDGKVVSPFFFLDISKRSNQYTKITKIVLEKSFKKFENLPFEFSVNISYEDIEDPEFLDFIKELLSKYDVSNRVVFEILEDENIKNYSHLINFIDEIKKLGCKVAIDDFGSGYSNFEHLLKMNVDYLKIDASLIKNIAIDENSYKITKTIIEFAKNLNLKTIAEFVENEKIFNLIKDLGADYSQGYYFSAPIAEPKLYDFKAGDTDE